MKKNIFIAAVTVIAALVMSICFTGCPNPMGLHNQNALLVTFKFTNFGDVSGDFAIPGDFNGDSSWERSNTKVDVQLKNGEGTSVVIPVTSDWIKFTLVPVDSWVRSWVDSVEGNSVDAGKNQNFYIGDGDYSLSMGEAVIVIDGSTGTCVLHVE